MAGGVYGDTLSAFPELLADYSIFDMPALPGGGYGDRYNHRSVTGAFRHVPGGAMGIMGGNREPNDVSSFWVFDDEAVKIGQGSYVEVDGILYVLTKDNGYANEGGFVKFMAGIVPGPTDKQTPDPSVIARAVNGFK
jgi:hypothetical protein